MDKEKFILNYIKEHTETLCLDAQFHNEYSDLFGGKRIYKTMGASPNKDAMKQLKKLYINGKIKRQVTGIKGMGWGWPHWVFTYYIDIKL